MAEAAIGRKILGEIEETSLDEVLHALRARRDSATADSSTSTAGAAPVTGRLPGNAAASAATASRSRVKSFPIPALEALVHRHFRASQSASLALSGRHLPLIYLLVATLVAAPHSKAVVVVDVDGRFDITRVLECVPFEQEQQRPPSGPGSTASDAQHGERLAERAPAPITRAGSGTEPAPKAAAQPGEGEGGAAGLPISTVSAASTSASAARSHHGDHQRSAVAAGGEGEGGGPGPPQPVPGRKLCVTLEDLRHIHVYRPARGSSQHLREVIASAEQHMVYGSHGSTSREWWGTVVIGGGSNVGTSAAAAAPTPADVTAGWRGWLRIDREEVRGFGVGMSVEEALADREKRQAAVEESGWVASCVWGGFAFSEAGALRRSER